MSDMLTEHEISVFKIRLTSLAAKLRTDIRDELLRSDNEHYIDLAGRVHDSGEESVADLLVDECIATIDREIRELRDVEAALQRIAMGSFGMCEDCGGEITTDRLLAQPAAARCVECQARVENGDRLAHYPKL
jgi:RNA polymerase-binding protein DksA